MQLICLVTKRERAPNLETTNTRTERNDRVMLKWQTLTTTDVREQYRLFSQLEGSVTGLRGVTPIAQFQRHANRLDQLLKEDA